MLGLGIGLSPVLGSPLSVAALFNITHDADNLDEYDSTVTDGGDLSTGTPGLAGSTAKMEVLIDDTTEIYGQVNQNAPASGLLRIRFYIDPNTITITATDSFVVVAVRGDGSPSWNIQASLKRKGDDSGYQMFVQAIEDDLSWNKSSDYEITDAPHYFEILSARASSDVASDGNMTFWIDGVLKETIGSLDNYDVFAEMVGVRMGGVTGLDAGTSGTIYLDELKANNTGVEIGA